MLKSQLYEVFAAGFALLGAMLLIKTFTPLLNPAMYQISTGRSGEELSYYLLRMPIPLLILTFSWYLNVTAQRLKQKH